MKENSIVLCITETFTHGNTNTYKWRSLARQQKGDEVNKSPPPPVKKHFIDNEKARKTIEDPI